MELCHLIEVLSPLDIYPCTADERTWDEDCSIEVLFGHLYSGKQFYHDQMMLERVKSQDQRPEKRRQDQLNDSQYTLSSEIDFEDHDSQSKSVGQGVPITPPRRTYKSSELLTKSIETPEEQSNQPTSGSHGIRVAVIRKSFETFITPAATSSQTELLESDGHYSLELEDREAPTSADLGNEPQLPELFPRLEEDELSDSETQISLSDSDFGSDDSQPTMTPSDEAPGSKDRFRHRKEAYLAATGRNGRDWAAYSPMSLGAFGYEAEVELK